MTAATSLSAASPASTSLRRTSGWAAAIDAIPRLLFLLYLVALLAYIFVPLGVMGAATFNTSRFPTVTPWLGTTLDWFTALANDQAMRDALVTSFLIAAGVIAFSLPVGTAAALVLTSLHGRARGFLYAVMVSPLLMPGVVIGISTLIFWRGFGIGGGLTLIVLAQSSFITAYVMLMVAARLHRFDRIQEEAALGLGASKGLIFRRILLPYLRPSLLAAGTIAFMQSIENYNTTLFVRGVETPLTIFIATKVRTGLTPAVNALGLTLMLVTIIGAILWELARRRIRPAH